MILEEQLLKRKDRRVQDMDELLTRISENNPDNDLMLETLIYLLKMLPFQCKPFSIVTHVNFYEYTNMRQMPSPIKRQMGHVKNLQVIYCNYGIFLKFGCAISQICIYSFFFLGSNSKIPWTHVNVL